VQPAKLEDVAAIEAIGFREADDHECLIATGDHAAEQCYKALEIEDSITLTIMNEGYPVGMFGIAPYSAMGVPPGAGVLWLLGSEGIKEIKDDFLWQWCEWVGFQFQEEIMYGHDPHLQELFVKAIRVPD
jgi:hypothetical protein